MTLLQLAWQTAKRALLLTPAAVTFTDSVVSMSGVEGRSMQPTLNPDGYLVADVLLLNKIGVWNYKYKHGDVVVLRSPEAPREWLVKRLIALQGDWVTVPGTYDICQIPKGHCWVEGDNGAVSSDSKNFGPVAIGLLEGRVTHIVWPPARVGPVESRLPEGRVLLKKVR